MTFTCLNGHPSESGDYCDVCGMPIDTSAAGATGDSGVSSAAPAGPAGSGSTAAGTAAPAAGGQPCPNCGTANVVDALFCEACGYDFTTGTMPRSAVALAPPDGVGPSSSTSIGLAETSTPPQAQVLAAATPNVSEQVPFSWVAEVWIDPAWYEAQESPDALPSAGLPAIIALHNKSVLIGRKSRSRNINPDIDCEPDTGTSRRQAQLTTDGTRWWVEDLESANGTFVGAASDPLPENPIPVGQKRELRPDDRIYVGAWTRLVIRQATDDELAVLG